MLEEEISLDLRRFEKRLLLLREINKNWGGNKKEGNFEN